MTTVLVTGGSGGLGHHLVEELGRAGFGVRVLSRRSRQAGGEGLPAAVAWAQADLASPEGLGEAVRGVDMVVHAATQSAFGPNGVRLGDLARAAREVEVEGTARLIQAGRQAGVKHFLYVSIVGIDHIPMKYYQYKLEAEALVMNSGLPWTIVRATHFHTLLDGLFKSLNRLPVFPVPVSFCWQPVETSEVARFISEVLAAPPQAERINIAGPERLTLGEAARAWLSAKDLRRRILPMPAFGPIAHAFRHGYTTCQDCRRGTLTWNQWLTTHA